MEDQKNTFKIFIVVSILLFISFLLDLCLSYVNVFNSATGQMEFVPVLYLIPLL